MEMIIFAWTWFSALGDLGDDGVFVLPLVKYWEVKATLTAASCTNSRLLGLPRGCGGCCVDVLARVLLASVTVSF